MNKKTIALIGLITALIAVAYAIYNNFSQLKDIDYDLFGSDEEEND